MAKGKYHGTTHNGYTLTKGRPTPTRKHARALRRSLSVQLTRIECERNSAFAWLREAFAR